MTWTKLCDTFWSHPKVIAVGNEGAGAFARMLSYAGAQLTDGHIPDGVAGLITTRKVLRSLVENRLLEPAENGYQIHDFLSLNPSRKNVESKREDTRSRVAEWRENKAKAKARNAVGNAVTTHVSNSVGNAVGNAAPDPTRPDPTEGERERESTHAHAHTREEPRCGTVERPNAPRPDEVEAVLVRGGGRKLDLRATATLKIHLRRAFVELGYPLAAWEALGRQIGTSTEALWPSDFLRALLARSGGKVTVAFLLGRKLDGADPAACGYDCAPLTEAFGRLAELRPREPAQGPQKPRGLPPPIPLASVGSAALGRAAMAAAMAAAPAPEEHPRG